MYNEDITEKKTLTLHPSCFVSFLINHSLRQFPELKAQMKQSRPNRDLVKTVSVKGPRVVLLKSRFKLLIQYICTYEKQTNT